MALYKVNDELTNNKNNRMVRIDAIKFIPSKGILYTVQYKDDNSYRRYYESHLRTGFSSIIDLSNVIRVDFKNRTRIAS